MGQEITRKWRNTFDNKEITVKILGESDMPEFIMEEIEEIMDNNRGNGWVKKKWAKK